MKKLILLLIPLLFLSSCTIDWNGEKIKKIAELEKQIQDDTFKKNKECLWFFKKISEEESYDSAFYGKEEEIFYNKELQTCIYAAISFRGHEENIGEKSYIKNRFIIKNILTNEYLYNNYILTNQKDWAEMNSQYATEFNNLKNSLK